MNARDIELNLEASLNCTRRGQPARATAHLQLVIDDLSQEPISLDHGRQRIVGKVRSRCLSAIYSISRHDWPTAAVSIAVAITAWNGLDTKQ